MTAASKVIARWTSRTTRAAALMARPGGGDGPTDRLAHTRLGGGRELYAMDEEPGSGSDPERPHVAQVALEGRSIRSLPGSRERIHVEPER
jgi:hypothetical protein